MVGGGTLHVTSARMTIKDRMGLRALRVLLGRTKTEMAQDDVATARLPHTQSRLALRATFASAMRAIPGQTGKTAQSVSWASISRRQDQTTAQIVQRILTRLEVGLPL